MKNLNALDVDDLKIHFKARKGTILNYLQFAKSSKGR